MPLPFTSAAATANRPRASLRPPRPTSTFIGVPKVPFVLPGDAGDAIRESDKVGPAVAVTSAKAGAGPRSTPRPAAAAGANVPPPLPRAMPAASLLTPTRSARPSPFTSPTSSVVAARLYAGIGHRKRAADPARNSLHGVAAGTWKGRRSRPSRRRSNPPWPGPGRATATGGIAEGAAKVPSPWPNWTVRCGPVAPSPALGLARTRSDMPSAFTSPNAASGTAGQQSPGFQCFQDQTGKQAGGIKSGVESPGSRDPGRCVGLSGEGHQYPPGIPDRAARCTRPAPL